MARKAKRDRQRQKRRQKRAAKEKSRAKKKPGVSLAGRLESGSSPAELRRLDLADRAHELLAQATEAPDRRRRIQLARSAIEAWPECSEAYLLLAEAFSSSPVEAIACARQALEAATRRLGPDAFVEDVGHFWGLVETRPYMRARAELAGLLWRAGRPDEAISHYQELLRLNPNDNQGSRFRLAAVLLEVERIDALQTLLGAYPEDIFCGWSYTRALLAYRAEGDSRGARALLEEAIKKNAHVPDFLLGHRRLPLEGPEWMGVGDENEAIEFCLGYATSWKQVPGALAWLEEAVEPEAC